MRLYYLDRELESEEVDFVADVLKLSEPIEQIRIPYVLPASDPNGGYRGRPIIESKLIEKHLLNAGILLDRDKKIFLVIPKDSHWHQSLIAAIFKLTGCYPCLIQTEDQRKNIDNPGDIRIVDMEELIGRNKTEI
jgi:hypothetical protein